MSFKNSPIWSHCLEDFGESSLTFVTGLELVEHDVQRRVVEDEVDVIFVELADRRQRHVVVRINEHLGQER